VTWIVDGRKYTSEIMPGETPVVPITPSKEGYVFVEWNKTADYTYEAVFKVAEYVIKFEGMDGTISEETLQHGDKIVYPEAPQVEGYIFVKWDNTATTATSDLTIKAIYEQKVYVVEFRDINDGVISRVNVKHGEDAIAPNAPKIAGKTFTDWSKDITDVKGNLVVKAEYKAKEYTVKYKDITGKVISTTTTINIDEIELIEAPEVEGHTFNSWQKTIDEDKDTVTMSATYDVNMYTVQYVDEDGVELATFNVPFGKDVDEKLIPTAPAKEGHDFDHWSVSSKNIREDVVISPVYKVKKFNYTFLDKDGKEITSGTFKYGESVEEIEYSVEGYDFIKWDVSDVNGNLTFTPVLSAKEYTIIIDGVSQTAKFGDKLTLPKTEDIVGFEDQDGNKIYNNSIIITKDLTLTSITKDQDTRYYEVVFMDGEDVMSSQTIKHGEAAVAPTTDKEGYTFKGWDTDFSNVTGDIVVNAKYEIKTYTVKYIVDGVVISNQTVDYGKNAKAPEATEREGYTFIGWDNDGTNVKSDLTINAKYEVKTYTVNFVANGETISTEIVNHGKGAKMPKAPKVEGKRFVGWDIDVSSVTSDLTVTAVYEDIYSKVSLVVDGETIDTIAVKYGDNVSFPNMEKEGYTFSGWSNEGKNVTHDMIITGHYSINTYTVSYFVDDMLISTESVDYGNAPTQMPTVEGIDWSKYVPSKVTQDIEVRAYKNQKVQVVFDMNGTKVTKWIDKGSSVEAPKPQEVEGHDFVKWDKELTNISEDTVITAIYKKKTFEVTFKYGDVIIDRQTVSYGENAKMPNPPVIAGYTFKAWDATGANIKSNTTINAIYEESQEKVNVGFKIIDETGKTIKTLDSKEFKSGQKLTQADMPALPTIDGYAKGTWSLVDNTAADGLVIKATYTRQSYNVVLQNESGNTVSTKAVKYGDSYTPDVSKLEKPGYTIIGLTDGKTSYELSGFVVKENMTLKPIYQKKSYTVTFVDINGNVIKTQEVAYGENAIAPNAPVVAGKEFTGWDKVFTNVTTPLTVKAMYKDVAVQKHTVTFTIDFYGEIYELKTVEVAHGTSALSQAPTMDDIRTMSNMPYEGFAIAGWSVDVNNVTGDITTQVQFGAADGWYYVPADKYGNEEFTYYADVNAGKELLALTNQARRDAGVPELQWSNSILDYTILRGEEVMVKFDHKRPNGTQWWSGIEGFSTKSAENITRNSGTAQQAFTAFFNSEGHKFQMLNADYNYASMILVNGAKGPHWVQIFWK